MNLNNWICSKCVCKEYETSKMKFAGSIWIKIFNVQNKKYTSVSCSRCSFAEFYKNQASSTIENVFDFFTN